MALIPSDNKSTKIYIQQRDLDSPPLELLSRNTHIMGSVKRPTNSLRNTDIDGAQHFEFEVQEVEIKPEFRVWLKNILYLQRLRELWPFFRNHAN